MKQHWESSFCWEVMLPGYCKNEALPAIEEKFVLTHINTKMVDRAKRSMSKWIRVLACDYKPVLNEWTPSNNITTTAEAHDKFWKAISFEGTVQNVVRIRHFRFSNYSWLKQEICGVVSCYKRRKQPGCVIMIPCRPYWFGEVHVGNDGEGKNMYRSLYLDRKFVYENFMQCLISLAIQKNGDWVVVPPPERKEIYDMLVKKPEKEMTESEKEFRRVQMKNVLQAKSNKRKRVETKPEKEATHLVFCKTKNTTLEEWVENTLRVRDISQYQSQANKGCFFALTEGGPLE